MEPTNLELLNSIRVTLSDRLPALLEDRDALKLLEMLRLAAEELARREVRGSSGLARLQGELATLAERAEAQAREAGEAGGFYRWPKQRFAKDGDGQAAAIDDEWARIANATPALLHVARGKSPELAGRARDVLNAIAAIEVAQHRYASPTIEREVRTEEPAGERLEAEADPPPG